MNEEKKEVIDTVITEESAIPEYMNDLTEIIIGIPKNSAMMRVSVLTVNEDGQAEGKTGEFNFEQLLQSRAKYIQLTQGTGSDSEPGGEESGDESDESSEEEGETTEEQTS